MKIILILTAVFCVKLVYSYCYWNDSCHYKYFSSKTPYEFVRGDIRDSVVELQGCKPISIWGLIRHGKRNPGESFIHKMIDAIRIKDYVKSINQKGKASICAQDVENLNDWEIDQDMFVNVHQLANEGYQEMIGIGYRLSKVFKELFTNLDDHSYKLRSAYGHWLENSIKGFAEGFGNKSMIIKKSNATYDIIAPYEACNFYLKNVRNNPQIYAAVTKYQNTTDYLVVKERIQERTGVNFMLTNENITSLYDLCRYTSSGLNNTLSPWCALFTEQDLKVLEYIGDLRHYFRNGYGTPINKIFGQVPLENLLDSFRMAKNGKGKRLTIYITHATMMDMVLTALGLFKDKIPLSSTYRNPKRKWRSSRNSAFASNLIATLNRCTDDKKIDYKVIFYLNEKPLKMLCDGGVCSWHEFEEKLKPFVNTTMNFC